MSGTQAKRWASAKKTPEFICVETYSGRGRTAQDPAGKQFVLACDATNQELGAAVLQALDHSRVLSLEEASAFFEYKAVKLRYEQWVADLVERYGYKTRRSLFKDMISCDIKSDGCDVVFVPTRHEKLEAWGREKGDGLQELALPVSSCLDEIGRALRLAFDRCV